MVCNYRGQFVVYTSHTVTDEVIALATLVDMRLFNSTHTCAQATVNTVCVCVLQKEKGVN